MINGKRVSQILEYRKWTVERNLDAPSEWWEELPIILSKNIEETIRYLDNLNEEDIEILSEIFEYIAETSQSKEFIKFIENLQRKYIEIDMKKEIQWAKNAIKD